MELFHLSLHGIWAIEPIAGAATKMQKNTAPQAEIVATKCRALAATRVKSTSTVFHDHFPTRKLKLP